MGEIYKGMAISLELDSLCFYPSYAIREEENSKNHGGKYYFKTKAK